MKTLEDIKIERLNRYIETGTDGINRQVSQKVYHKLQVKTINSGLRFVHLIVDYFIIVILNLLVSFIPIFNESLLTIINQSLILLYPIVYILSEYKFQQTPGKFITGHIVINQYAEKPDLRTCVLRTLIRFVPFEPFSCMSSPSRGWHDIWSKTYVVSKKEALLLKQLLEKENNI